MQSLERLIPPLLFALAVAVYAALAQAGFVWDDEPLVVGNTLTGRLANWPLFFQVDLWQSAETGTDSGYYRPLVLLSFALDRALWGLSAAGHHLHSLAWHLLAGGLFFGLARRLLSGPAAAVALAIFLLHPLQSEAVAWIAARNDLMAAAFVFGAVWALLPPDAPVGRLLVGGALGLAGLLSKESAVFAVALLGMLDLARHGRPLGLRRYAALGAAVVSWFGLRTLAGVSGASLPGPEHRSFLVERFADLVAHYARLVVWPQPLTVGDTLEYLDDPLALVAVGWGVLLLGTALLLLRGGRLAAAGLAFAALAVLPALIAIGVRGQLGQRYLYLPLAGIALAVGAALPARRASLLPLALLLPVWLVQLHERLPDWQNPISLWAAAVDDEANGFTWTSLAHELNREGRRIEATRAFHEALRDRPPYSEACAPAVLAPLKAGELELAAEGIALGLEVGCPPERGLVGARGLVLLQLGRVDEARELVAEEAVGGDPRRPLVLAALALLDGDEATFRTLSEEAGQDPDFADKAETVARIAGYDPPVEQEP